MAPNLQIALQIPDVPFPLVGRSTDDAAGTRASSNACVVVEEEDDSSLSCFDSLSILTSDDDPAC